MRKNTVTFIVILAGLLLGSFIGELVSSVSWLNWLNYGKAVGIQNFDVNLYAINFNLSLTLKCTVSTILGLIISTAVCLKIFR